LSSEHVYMKDVFSLNFKETLKISIKIEKLNSFSLQVAWINISVHVLLVKGYLELSFSLVITVIKASLSAEHKWMITIH